MLCPYRKRTTSYNEIKTVYKDDNTSFPTTVTITEEQFDLCIEHACRLYDRVQNLCLLGRKQYGT